MKSYRSINYSLCLCFLSMAYLLLIRCNSGNSINIKSVASPVTPSQNLYSTQSLYMNDLGIVLQGEIAIHHYISSQHDKIPDSARILYSVPALPDSTMVYEIGKQWSKEKQYTYLKILKTEGDLKKIELQYIAESSESGPDTIGINQQRKEWVNLCNQHDAFKLVSTLYTPDAIYFNHKPIVAGTENIAKEYGYMNNKTYSLRLNPLHIEQLTPALIYEIGQCQGSYGGKYILIWKKSMEGIWKVSMDSNI